MAEAEPFRAAARDLTVRYALALGLIALLTLAAQAVVQVALHHARSDAEVVNLAGRQRMLSQRLCKAALAWKDTAAPARLDEVRQVLGEWSAAQRRLGSGHDLANAGSANSPAVSAAFSDLEPRFRAMVAAAEALPAQASAVEALLVAEDGFLAGMEGIVTLYRDEAQRRVQHLIGLELGLCGGLLVVLLLEALLVFRPAVRRLRQGDADRERLRRQELEHAGLQVAADTARGIGQDLHDGLGQTLTALSFQAKALEQAAVGSPGATTARELSAGIADAIAQCRAQARRLAPVEIQAAGLDGALRELADATARAAGITCTLDWRAPGPPTAAGGELFRIVQEAVTNALRHGRARSIRIVASQDELRIADDGVGGAEAGEGVGLRSMRARAERIAARLVYGPGDGGGWEVRLVFQ